MPLQTKKMNLFDAPHGVLVHACNCRGVWGSGIAKAMKVCFPGAYDEYRKECNTFGHRLKGASYLSHRSGTYYIGCLFTSEGYGACVDDEETVLTSTETAIDSLLSNSIFDTIGFERTIPVYSNKFNSGLFNVPWEKTEAVLKTVLERYPHIDWTVCEL